MQKSQDILTNLNQEQIQAVTHKDGPLLIIAGAGTGKTTVITRRIAWLIDQKLAKPDEILALTFTDKAAKEMQERIDVLVPYGYTDIWISTFHAFGDRVLREFAESAGISGDFKVMTRPEAVVFFRERIFDFELKVFRPLSEPTRFIEALINLFSRAKDEDISCKDYLDYVLRLKQVQNLKKEDYEKISTQEEIALCYKKYQELMLKEARVDFASQFYLSLELFRNKPSILKYYQNKFKYILVDEFQDTNLAQFELIKLLAGNDKNVTVNADDDQCIFRFRGAAYSNMINFINEYPEAKKISLVKNYRSTQKILDSAYLLIQNNNPERFEVKSNINKRLVSEIDKAGEVPKHFQFDNISSEADFVAKTISEYVKNKSYNYQDFAVLVRSNNDADEYIRSLNMLEIPWRFSGNQGLYQKQEVKLCINFLRLMANISDSLSLYYLAANNIYKIPVKTLSLCMQYSRKQHKSLYSVFESLVNIEELSEISTEDKDAIDYLVKDIEKFLNRSVEYSTGRLLYTFLDETKYLKSLVKTQNSVNETKVQNLAKFFELVQNFENIAKEDRVLYFIQYLDLLIDAGSDPETAEADFDVSAVNILTIHKAKGLEFPVVFLVNLVQGRFPVVRRKSGIELPEELIKDALPKGEIQIQEERRLFYVGLTRAQKEVILCSNFDCGGKTIRKVSPFVFEALGINTQAQAQKTSSIDAIQRYKPAQEKVKLSSKKVLKSDEILNLSYYQIDDYSTCPLKYKYVHILHIPIMKHHTVVYGSALHAAVQKYFSYKMRKENLAFDELIKTFNEAISVEGFLSGRHFEERLKVGRKALEHFYKNEEKNSLVPTYIEKPFSFLLGNNRLSGRWDRVDENKDGTVIIDFKSSEVDNQKDADKKAKDSLQLTIYALAYKNIFGVLPKKTELHFLESGLVGSVVKDEGDLEKAEEKISEVSIGLRDGNFEANPTFMACKYCAYNQICPSVK